MCDAARIVHADALSLAVSANSSNRSEDRWSLEGSTTPMNWVSESSEAALSGRHVCRAEDTRPCGRLRASDASGNDEDAVMVETPGGAGTAEFVRVPSRTNSPPGRRNRPGAAIASRAPHTSPGFTLLRRSATLEARTAVTRAPSRPRLSYNGNADVPAVRTPLGDLTVA